MKYELDTRFYAIAVVALVVVLLLFTLVNRALEHSRGKDVQVLLHKANLDSDEHFRDVARNFAKNAAAQYRLDSKQAKKVEDIYFRALKERSSFWIQDRLAGRSSDYTNQKLQASWERYHQEISEYLRSIGKR
ncbi:MAG: hypothetical protein V2A74_02970 [bacterium]